MGNVEFGIGYLTTSARAAQGSTTTPPSKSAPSESIIWGFICFSVCLGRSASAANGPDVVGCNRIQVIIVEMGPQIIYHGGDLIVAHHRPEWGHSTLSVDDDGNRISAGFEVFVARERWIGSSACCTPGVGHVAAPADIGEQFLAAHLNEPEALAQRGHGSLRVRHERQQ